MLKTLVYHSNRELARLYLSKGGGVCVDWNGIPHPPWGSRIIENLLMGIFYFMYNYWLEPLTPSKYRSAEHAMYGYLVIFVNFVTIVRSHNWKV